MSEVLSGKRAITMPMARALHEHLGIPADVLLRQPGTALDETLADIEWTRFPLKAMAKLRWFPDGPDLAERAEELIGALIERAGGQDVVGAALYRKNDHLRVNAKMDPYAFKAWCWQILARRTKPAKGELRMWCCNLGFLKKVARLSGLEDGPRLAKTSWQRTASRW